jgi:serine/threonine protein kinase
MAAKRPAEELPAAEPAAPFPPTPPAAASSGDREGWTAFAMPSGSLPFTSGEADDFGFRAGPAATLAPGTDIGGITIVRLLGAGGMGCVYEARQHAPDRPVAVKLMREGVVSPTQFKRFEYEAEVLGRLEHPGIARV